MGTLSMRPLSARWFHVLVAFPDYERAAERLAASKLVELDTPGSGEAGNALAGLVSELARCRELCLRHQDYLPPAAFAAESGPVPSAAMLAAALNNLSQWERDTAASRARLERLRTELAELEHWRQFVRGCNSKELNLAFSGMTALDGDLVAVLLVLPAKTHLPDYPGELVVYRTVNETHVYLLAIGTRSAERELVRLLGGNLQQHLLPPDWLSGESARALPVIDAHIMELERTISEDTAVVNSANDRLDIPDALGTVQRIDWAVSNLRGMRMNEYIAHIVGWTSDTGGERLESWLAEAGIPAVIDFPGAPAGKEPPVISNNPVWARPFELFVRLLGVPGQNEPDPSRLLTVIAPLLFGYMFGDMGQGAVLIVTGLLLRRRWPVMTLLISGGVAAMLFGYLFGTVFCVEEAVHPLWVSPLDDPVTVLFLPILGGAVLILISLILSGVRAFWSARLGEWMKLEGGLVLLYCGAIALPFWMRAGWVAIGTGLLWSLGGGIAESFRHGAGAVISALVELIERVLQLGINTLSFVRVGAFALAHAGLSLAFVSLARTTHTAWLAILILVVGNVLILGLEGLIVFVQTTRLILFEFFTRFLTAAGRQFHPSAPPAAT